MKKRPYVIAVTGTKGKTTIVRLLDHILRTEVSNLLRVDSDGHYVDGKQKSTNQDSVDLGQAAPTVCPGKYLYELLHKEEQVAVFEVAIGSNGPMGLGYRGHNIGVLHNVYEDHLGIRISNREMLAESKAKLVFGRLSKLAGNAYACFNMNDKLVCDNLYNVNKSAGATLIPYGIEGTDTFFD
jgi:cyanophycin synthetase